MRILLYLQSTGNVQLVVVSGSDLQIDLKPKRRSTVKQFLYNQLQ